MTRLPRSGLEGRTIARPFNRAVVGSSIDGRVHATIAKQTKDDTGASGARAGTAPLPSNRHRLAALDMVDMHRQEAARVVKTVEQRELLMAVHRVAGVVDVQHDRRRRDREGAAEDVDQRGRQARHLDPRGRVLQPAHGGLRTEIPTALRCPADRQLKQRILPKRVAVVGIFVPTGDREHAEAIANMRKRWSGRPLPAASTCARVVSRSNHLKKEASMEQVTTIAIDLAKHSFQLHGAQADGSVAFRKKLSRGKLLDFLASQPRCSVAMEACASAHYWGRETGKLGHEVKLIPPVYVKPFVKRHKNDTTDAEAICEAAQRPTMSVLAVKSEGKQARGMLFRTRDLLVRQRTQTINALRAHLAEFGVVAPQGPAHVSRLAATLEDPGAGLPELVRELGGLLLEQIACLDERVVGSDKDLRACARRDEEALRLMTIGCDDQTTSRLHQADARIEKCLLSIPIENFSFMPTENFSL